ncbi:MAG: M1 family peptidase, partial [Planctomycetota bacterium]|nr:M1 family peptidase [Planctomycetota bacterium]
MVLCPRQLLSLSGALLLSCPAFAACEEEEPNTSGGALLEEQACFDVVHYDLAIEVMPDTRSIKGTLTMTADAVSASREIVLHLDQRLHVIQVNAGGAGALERVRAVHEDGMIFVDTSAFPTEPGARFRVRVVYEGVPLEAPRPPWEGGFTWAETKDGAPWIATSCQGEGADLWWPCKDHPSDKPEGFDLHVTVPAGLVCATTGRRLSSETAGGQTTSHWRVTTPIANYTVALNIAPYLELSRTVKSVAGDEYPVIFWALPENEEEARAFMDEIVDHLAFFEEFCGPYPFRGDKYGVVET